MPRAGELPVEIAAGRMSRKAEHLRVDRYTLRERKNQGRHAGIEAYSGEALHGLVEQKSTRKQTPPHCAVSRRKIAASSRSGWTWEHEELNKPNRTETTDLAVTKSKRGITIRKSQSGHMRCKIQFFIKINIITINPQRSPSSLSHLIEN
jgi:hypothetical protein